MRVLFLAGLLLSACATPRAERVPFAEAFAREVLSPQDDLVLERFAQRAARAREVSGTGASMAPAALENWAQLLTVIDLWRARPAEARPVLLTQARELAERELAFDLGHYRDVPVRLAQALTERFSPTARRRATRPRTTLTWPLDTVAVTSGFGQRLHPLLGYVRAHEGIDLAAARGQLVTAAAPGRVVFAGWSGSSGLQVELDHGNGMTTRYRHLSQVLVERGLEIEQGAPVGLAGSTGLSTGVHLHFEVLHGGRPLDPLKLLGAIHDGELAAR